MENATPSATSASPSAPSARSRAPVFVLGSPRSGTTYLYHMLLSAGNFAIYRAESEVFHMLEPRFGDLSVAANKIRLLHSWFKSRLFTATGLAADSIEKMIMEDCRNGGDFLRIVMEEMARQQGVERWAECTPDHILYLSRIKQTIPNALVIHIIRDGRDVALSMEKQGYPRRLPWDRNPQRMAAGVYWEWIVRKGREDGAKLGSDYLEVRYEDLIDKPLEVLARLSTFIDQRLDYEEIRRVGIGSVDRPNTSFQKESVDGNFSPIGRWRKHYSPKELAMFEGLVGGTLRELGYALETEEIAKSFKLSAFHSQYQAYFQAKFQLRTKTRLGRLMVTGDLSNM
jgi:Sulfotransferase family